MQASVGKATLCLWRALTRAAPYAIAFTPFLGGVLALLDVELTGKPRGTENFYLAASTIAAAFVVALALALPQLRADLDRLSGGRRKWQGLPSLLPLGASVGSIIATLAFSLIALNNCQSLHGNRFCGNHPNYDFAAIGLTAAAAVLFVQLMLLFTRTPEDSTPASPTDAE